MAFPSSFELSAEDVRDDVRILVLTGEADRFRTDEVDTALGAARDADRHVIVDLTRVSYLDSTMLSTLVGASEQGRRRAEEFVVLCETPRLRRSLALKGLESVLQIAATRDDALRMVSGGGDAQPVHEEQA